MERQRPVGILASTLRPTLQAVNVVLAVTGVSMLGYAAYMYVDYEHITFSTDQSSHIHPRLLDWVIQAHRHGSPWFIYAFGGAGLFLFLTAISGLYGACYSNRHCLNFYSTMVVVMLLAQCALLVGYFADQSWKKKLPHDDTGEAAKSGIHGWGLIARTEMKQDSMVVEYRGDLLRPKMSEDCQKFHNRIGKDCYLFNVDDDIIVDATMSGAIGRFTNHCCAPSMYTKVVEAEGESRLVFFACTDIKPGQELTYDYRFKEEEGDDKVQCKCGAPNCRGTLN